MALKQFEMITARRMKSIVDRWMENAAVADELGRADMVDRALAIADKHHQKLVAYLDENGADYFQRRNLLK